MRREDTRVTELTQLSLHRRQVHLTSADLDGVLDGLRPLMAANADAGRTGPFSVVNIGVEGAPLRLFCSPNVHVALAANADMLAVDLAPTVQYVQFARNGVELTMSVAGAVSALLRTTPVASCVAQLAELRQRLELMALLADGFALQHRDAQLADAAQHVSGTTRSLIASAGRADNVACLDDLRYALMPALAAVAEAMRRHVITD